METPFWVVPTPRILESPADVAREMVAELTFIAERAVRLRGRCVLVIGLTPACLMIYRAWITASSNRAFWHYTIVFQSDEPEDRGLAPGRGSVQDESVLWDEFPVPRAQLHRMAGGDEALAGSIDYERTIRMALELRPGVDAEFDVAMLEVASGGRLAGLAPDQWLGLQDGRLVVPSAHDAGGISLSPIALASAEFLVLLAVGTERSEIAAQWLDPEDPLLEPIRGVLASRPGSAMLVMDRHASRGRTRVRG